MRSLVAGLISWDNRMTLDTILQLGPVMPVIVIDEAADAVPLADALLAGGIKAIEITLRTQNALDVIQEIASHRPELAIGAGTILSAEQAKAAKQAGAQFAVSPGSTQAVLDGCKEADLPLLPGAATVSEMMSLAEQGYHHLKFFPAVAAGGLAYIKSLASPLPHLKICPTGGITQQTAPDWLAVENIICVGGSWIAPRNMIAEGSFLAITERAAAAQALRKA